MAKTTEVKTHTMKRTNAGPELGTPVTFHGHRGPRAALVTLGEREVEVVETDDDGMKTRRTAKVVGLKVFAAFSDDGVKGERYVDAELGDATRPGTYSLKAR